MVQLAEQQGVFLQLALTNNWNPLPLVDNTTTGLGMITRDITQGTNNSLPRNTLSNDYGQQFINYLAFELKVHVQEEWMSTSGRLVLPMFTNMITSIQIQRFLMPS